MNKNILIIKEQKSQKDEGFIEKLNTFGTGSKFYYGYYKDVTAQITKDKVEFKIYGKDIKEYDLIYFKVAITTLYEGLISSLIEYLNFYNIKYIGTLTKIPGSSDKLFQNTVFALKGLPIPKTIYMSLKMTKDKWDFIKSTISIPFIIKSAIGTKGESNYLVNDKNEFEELITIIDRKTPFIIQEFIPNSEDYRIIVLKDKPILGFKRIRDKSKTHKNNTTLGAQKDFINIDKNPELKELAIKANLALNRDIGGVDIVISEEDKQLYLLEVNSNPAMGNNQEDMKSLSVHLQNI